MLLKKEATREFQRFVFEQSQRESECWSWNRKIFSMGRIVSRTVLNTKFTYQGKLSSKRFKLLNVTPVQIKPTLFANDR